MEAQVVLACGETWGAFEQARRDAQYIYATTKQQQRLLYADVSVTDRATVRTRSLTGDPLWRVRMAK